MTDPAPKVKTAPTLRSAILRLLAALLLTVSVACYSGYRYLVSPRGTAHLAAVLAEYLQLPVSISRIAFNGDTLVIRGLALDNPPGFAAKRFLAIDTVSLTPDWQGLLSGKRALRSLQLAGPQLDLHRNAEGKWNFQHLQKPTAGGKGGGELLIATLKISNGELLVNGKGLRGLSLALRNLATKGSASTRAQLDCTDESGNRYAARGSFRLGVAPEADLTLEAPALAIGSHRWPAAGQTLRLDGGRGEVRLQGSLHDGILRMLLAAAIDGAGFGAGTGSNRQLSGELAAAAAYDLKQDSLSLESLSLSLADFIDLRAAGNIAGLKSGADYRLDLAVRHLELGSLSALVPALARAGVRLEGTVAADGVTVAGKARNITTLDGKVSLRNLEISRGSTRLATGIATDMRLASRRGSIEARGELHQTGNGAGVLVDKIAAPYALRLSAGLKPQVIDLPGFSASLAGVPLTGSLSLRPGTGEFFRLAVTVPDNSLQPFTYGDLRLNSGAFGAALDLKGTGVRDFTGNLDLRADGLAGSLKGEPAGIGKLRLTTAISRTAGDYALTGRVGIDTSRFKGVAATGAADFTTADGRLRLANVSLQTGETSLTVAGLVAAIPRKSPAPLPPDYPLDITAAGGSITHRDVRMTGLAAALHGVYGGAAGAGRFAGNGSITAQSLSWRGTEAGAPQAALVVSPSGGSATLGGELFGGTLAGKVAFDPYDRAKSVTYDLSLTSADLAKASLMAATRGAAVITAGRLTASSSGSYSRQDGISSRVHGEGTGIAVANAGGKGLLADAGLQFEASLGHGRLLLSDARFRLGEEAVIQVKGSVDNILTPERVGAISFGLAGTPLARVIDPLANGLPRLLQESAVSGDVAAHALLTIHDRKARVDGFVKLNGAGLDAEAHKLKIAGVSGEIPFMTVLPPVAIAPGEALNELTRENYPRHLERFRQAEADGSPLRIGRIGFGPLEFRETLLKFRAADGRIEVASLAAALAGGELLGKGHFSLAKAGGYAGDIVINNLSLKQLCDLFPKIKGYVSGRVDGLVSINGGGAGSGQPNGDLDLWTREGDGEKMLVSREFLQKLAGKNLQGFFFRDDRPFDRGEVKASLADGYLTFDILDISHTNLFGVSDLKVTVTESQNRIALDHLLDSIKQAAKRGKADTAAPAPAEAAPAPEFKWDE